MNIQRLVSIGCVGFFMVLAVIGLLAADNSPAINSNHPLPMGAPAPTQAPAQTTPAPPSGTAPIVSQPLPQPQPVPVPPAAAATVTAPTQAGAAAVSILPLLLFVSTVGLVMGLAVLVKERRRENSRFPHQPILAHGAQS